MSLAKSTSEPSRPPQNTYVWAPSSAGRSMLCITLRTAYRRTLRSLLVNPPSLNTGSWNRLVVTMGTTIPVSSRASRNSAMIRSRSWALLPGGIKSSSWKVIPYAPISASRLTASTVARTGRVASPNRSRACQPTVQSPKLNLSSRVGLRSMSARVSVAVMTAPQLLMALPVGRSSPFDRAGEPTDDAAFEHAEEHQGRDHRQRGEREHLRGVDRVLRRKGLHAQRQGESVLVVQDEQRQQVAVPAGDERQDPDRDQAGHRKRNHHSPEEVEAAGAVDG